MRRHPRDAPCLCRHPACPTGAARTEKPLSNGNKTTQLAIFTSNRDRQARRAARERRNQLKKQGNRLSKRVEPHHGGTAKCNSTWEPPVLSAQMNEDDQRSQPAAATASLNHLTHKSNHWTARGQLHIPPRTYPQSHHVATALPARTHTTDSAPPLQMLDGTKRSAKQPHRTTCSKIRSPSHR